MQMLNAKQQSSKAAKRKSWLLFLGVLGVLAVNYSVLAQEEVMWIGGGVVNTLIWSPDGESLFVGANGGRFILNQQLDTVEYENAEKVVAASWKPDDPVAIIQGVDGCYLASRLLPDCPKRLVWSPNDEFIAAIAEQSVYLIDPNSEAVISLANLGQTAAWSSDGTQLAIGGQDSLLIWNVAEERLVFARAGQGFGDVLRWDTDGLLMLCYEQTDTQNVIDLCQFNFETQQMTTIRELLWRHPGEAYPLEWIQADDHHIAFTVPTANTADVYVFPFEAGDYKIFSGRVFALAPDAVTVASPDGAVRSYDIETGDVLAERQGIANPSLTSVVWSPDSTQLTAISSDHVIHTWEVDLSAKSSSLEQITPDENTTNINFDVEVETGAPDIQAAAWDGHAQHFATLSTSGETAILEVWDVDGNLVSTAVQIGVLEIESRIWWSDTGDMLLISGRHRDYEAFSVWVYDTATGHLVLRYGTPQSYPPKIAWKADDSLIAVETNSAIVFLDTATAQPTIEQIPASYINWLDWSPDGAYLAGAGADGTIRIWDVSQVGTAQPTPTP